VGRQRRRDEPTDGYAASLTPAQLIELRNHDVSGAFVQQMRVAGLGELSVADLIELHDHDVTPRFVRDLREVGFTELTRDDVVALRNHDIGAAFLREMRDVGLAEATPARLIALHDHGVAADLDIAYNTARNRLDDIVAALGVSVERADGGQGRERRVDVLRRLSAGEIAFDEAMRLLER
jgi:hypothetical protein